jgi:phospholipid transport system substrate-binding protein
MAAIVQFSAPASAAPDPEQFTQGLIDQGVAILQDTAQGTASRNARFRDFLLTYADARATALFTLGSYRRGASDADIEAFVAAFTDYATAIYESRLQQYAGQTLKVTGKLENKAGDYTVNAMVVGESDPGEPLKVAFRILERGGSYKFVDANVAGVWLSIEQRDQFASFLNSNGGSVAKLATHLRQQAAQMAGR